MEQQNEYVHCEQKTNIIKILFSTVIAIPMENNSKQLNNVVSEKQEEKIKRRYLWNKMERRIVFVDLFSCNVLHRKHNKSSNAHCKMVIKTIYCTLPSNFCCSLPLHSEGTQRL